VQGRNQLIRINWAIATTILTSYQPARIIMPARIAAGIRVNDSKGRQSGFSEDREAITERG